MGFKVVNIFALPGADFGDELLDSLDATLVKGLWKTEEEIIAHAHDADAIIGVVSIQPFNRRLLTALPRCRVSDPASGTWERLFHPAPSCPW